MAYILDEELVRKQQPETFKGTSIYQQGKKLKVSKFKIERASFSKEADLNYQVSGLAKISIIREDGEYEELYSYTTRITVNKEDKIESCEAVYLNKF